MSTTNQAQRAALEKTDEIEEMIQELKHGLECERALAASKPGYNWSDFGDVAAVAEQLKQVITFWNGGDQDA